jgi:hypothetical protein
MPGDGNFERFRGFEIDHEGKLARVLDREIAGPNIGVRMVLFDKPN